MDEPFPDRDEFTRVVSRDMEKADVVVDFPVSGPIPTYSVAFGDTTKSQSKASNTRSFQSLESVSSAGLGSPLHDPVFLDPSPDYPHLQVPKIAVPPRFRSNNYSSGDISGPPSNGSTQSVDVERNISTTSTDSGSNPFSLDTEARYSVASSVGRRTYVTTKPARAYAKPSPNLASTMSSKHIREGSAASSMTDGKKRWVID